MRFMVIVPGNEDSENSVMPTTEQLAEMGRYNEELAKAGVMVDGNGLHPTSNAKKLVFGGGSATVFDGPFAETKELAGYWILQTDTYEECVDWVKKAPFDEGTAIVIRPVFEPEDFGDQYTDEIREQEDRVRAQVEQTHG